MPPLPPHVAASPARFCLPRSQPTAWTGFPPPPRPNSPARPTKKEPAEPLPPTLAPDFADRCRHARPRFSLLEPIKPFPGVSSLVSPNSRLSRAKNRAHIAEPMRHCSVVKPPPPSSPLHATRRPLHHLVKIAPELCFHRQPEPPLPFADSDRQLPPLLTTSRRRRRWPSGQAVAAAPAAHLSRAVADHAGSPTGRLPLVRAGPSDQPRSPSGPSAWHPLSAQRRCLRGATWAPPPPC